MKHNFQKAMWKRPRAGGMFNTACVSVVTEPSSDSCDAANETKYRNSENKRKCSAVDAALAEIDIGLGLGCSPTTKLASVVSSPAASFDTELDGMKFEVQMEDEKGSVISAPLDDTESCVSGFGEFERNAIKIGEVGSSEMDVMSELYELDSRTSITLTSPQRGDFSYNRKYRLWNF